MAKRDIWWKMLQVAGCGASPQLPLSAKPRKYRKKSGLKINREKECVDWLGWQDSNLQPTVPKTGALPIELHPKRRAYLVPQWACCKGKFVAADLLRDDRKIQFVGAQMKISSSLNYSHSAGLCVQLNPNWNVVRRLFSPSDMPVDLAVHHQICSLG